MYGSTTEEQRQANEVRRLKRELHDARDQVMSLSSQLSTNVSQNFYSNNFKTSNFFVMFCSTQGFEASLEFNVQSK